MFDHGDFDSTNFRRLYAVSTSEPHWRKPELAFAFWCPDVNMWRFPAFVRIKMKSPVQQAQDGGHGCSRVGVRASRLLETWPLLAHSDYTSHCGRPGAVPGYVVFGLSHGARLKVDIGQGRFVFFFLPLAE